MIRKLLEEFLYENGQWLGAASVNLQTQINSSKYYQLQVIFTQRKLLKTARSKPTGMPVEFKMGSGLLLTHRSHPCTFREPRELLINLDHDRLIRVGQPRTSDLKASTSISSVRFNTGPPAGTPRSTRTRTRPNRTHDGPDPQTRTGYPRVTTYPRFLAGLAPKGITLILTECRDGQAKLGRDRNQHLATTGIVGRGSADLAEVPVRTRGFRRTGPRYCAGRKKANPYPYPADPRVQTRA
ncbi:hypothetical protein R3P38DRAFT_2788312 [Favolaschia claudopus]|uniref:Ribosomal protein L2 n=1 Tax=Favolaschia claudopus TaxID=2862362 RepID=A0AAW0ALW5_9AGAR